MGAHSAKKKKGEQGSGFTAVQAEVPQFDFVSENMQRWDRPPATAFHLTLNKKANLFSKMSRLLLLFQNFSALMDLFLLLWEIIKVALETNTEETL